jgi:regulator of protease activity HflC (stomatin/prohibitin superfamily)
MLRAMAKQAKAEREKRLKIIHAEGEYSAAQRLVERGQLAGRASSQRFSSGICRH